MKTCLAIAVVLTAQSALGASLTIRVVNNEGYGYRAYTTGTTKISFNRWIGSKSEASKWTGETQIWALMRHELVHALGYKTHSNNIRSPMHSNASPNAVWQPADKAWLIKKRKAPGDGKPYTVNVKWGDLSGLPAKGGGTVPTSVVRDGCIRAMQEITTLCNVRYVLPGKPDPPKPPKDVDTKKVEAQLKVIEKAIDRIRGEISISP